MKKLLTAVALISVSALAMAQTPATPDPAPAKAPTAQQTKMGQCNKDAVGKTGDERRVFMKDCLSAKSAAAGASAPVSAQQEKMKSCNADAKTKALKGPERAAFMKECLSK